MTPRDLASAFTYLFDVGKDILFAGLDKATATILCQLGNATDQVADSDSAELWQQPGFWSLPAAPTQGKPSCQAVVLKRSDRDIIIATRDLRSSSIYGNLKPGETCVGASTGQARTLYKANGAIIGYTTRDNTPSGQSVINYTGPDKIQFAIGTLSITMDPATQKITISAGPTALVLDGAAGKATLSGTQAALAGSLVAVAGSIATCIGANAIPSGVPGTTPGPTSCLLGLTGVAAVPSHNVFIGP